MFSPPALNIHLALATFIILTAALCLWLGQQFSTTLLQISASQLLEQELTYLQTQAAAKAGMVSDPIAKSKTQPFVQQYDAVQPSRSYFKLHAATLPDAASGFAHDTAVAELLTGDDQALRYARVLQPATATTATLWLELNLSEALPLANFLQLLQVVCTALIVLLGGACLWLVYRLHLAQRHLASALQREQNFVNDISHELRTPLAIVHNALAVNDGRLLTVQAIYLAKTATAAMTQQLNVLLALARKQQTPTLQLPLLQQLEQAMFTLYQTEPEFISQIKVDLPEQMTVNGNPQLIQLLLLNIVSNACYHSGGTVLHICSTRQKVQFMNQIQWQTDGTAATSTRYQGFGHGNSLIRRIAAELGWSIDVQRTETQYQITIGVK